MKFTSEDLMKAMGLQVGDRISTFTANGEPIIFKVEEISGSIFYEKEGIVYSLFNLIGREFEILPRPKRVGDLECIGNCKKCPIRYACNVFSKNIDIDFDCGYPQTRYIALDLLNIKDQEIYDLLKKKLDKEVMEE